MGRPQPKLPVFTPYDRQKIRREQKRERIRNKHSLRPLVNYGLMCYGLGALTILLIHKIAGIR